MSTPAPVPQRLFRLGGSAEIAALINEAGGLAFPGVVVVPIHGLAGTPPREQPGPDGTLLALVDPSPGVLDAAQTAIDESGLPRWAVVVLDAHGPESAAGSETIPQRDWNAPALARSLRLAWEHHVLARDNARLRGDLMTFGTRIAHDLRTPLGGVLTTAEMLREVLADDAPADVPLTQPILDSTDGMVKLIERAGFFARASASREPPRLLDMSTPFWNAFQQLEGRLIKANISLTYPPTWPSVYGHENWLQVVWAALLTNALEHGEMGARKIEAGWSTEASGLRFWVRNRGVIPPAKRPTLFHPFHRLHEAGAPRGLGLSIVQRLVEVDRGACGFLMPEPGVVEFFFLLPIPTRSQSASGTRPPI